MACRYIALIADPRRGDQPPDAAVTATLARLGLRTRFAVGRTTVHLSSDTPARSIEGAGVLIGHLFARSPSSADARTALGHCSSSAAVRKRILAECWGDYLLIQATADGEGVSLLRDPSGGIPAVYSLKDGSGFITSDVSLATALGLCNREVDWEFVAHCLAFPTHKARRTALAGISELPAGCTLSVLRGHARVEPAWNPWDFVAAAARHEDPAAAASGIRNAVTSAVHAWAETDRSVLLELSGGLDSSIVAAALKGTEADITLCTLKTPVPGTDERQYARQVADHLGLPLSVEDLGFDTADIHSASPESAAAPRMGVLQQAVGSVMASAAERHGVESHLSGAGGDTVFCYLSSAAPATDALRTKGTAAWASAVRDLAVLHRCTLWKAGRLSLKKLATRPPPLLRPDHTFVNPSRVASDPERHPWFDVPANALPGDRERVAGLAGAQIFRDIAPRGCRHMRMPLMSQPVVEAALRTPTWMWIAGGRNRAVARDAFADVLPAGILARQSKGTFAGYLGALHQRHRHLIRRLLLTGMLQDRQMLDADAVSRYLAHEAPPKDRGYLRILSLCMIENWLRLNARSP
ncbi:asparagine synthase-related protein [Luteimonas soli]|uniref:asparagine synthase (glutamine-hydrolyzing) n=1 Tax=Luteimonas soli TaxID=1648966 RepID=A0ABV7XNV2_9GAMM